MVGNGSVGCSSVVVKVKEWMDVFNRGSAVRGSAVRTLVTGDWISGLKPVVSWWMVWLARDLVDVLPVVCVLQWISKQWVAGAATRSIG